MATATQPDELLPAGEVKPTQPLAPAPKTKTSPTGDVAPPVSMGSVEPVPQALAGNSKSTTLPPGPAQPYTGPQPPAGLDKENMAIWQAQNPDWRPPEEAQGQTAGQPAAGQPNAWDPTTGLVEGVRQADTQDVEATGYTAGAVGPAATADATGYDATGYDPTKAPDAVGAEVGGYDPTGYTAEQAGENLSAAIDRIIGGDSVFMQRARNQANEESASRGLLASSQAVGAAQGAVLDRAAAIGAGDVQAAQFNVTQKNDALRFSAAARNDAAAFLANAKNQAAMALAAEKNQNGRFNAQQANDAAQFVATAKNNASAFLAQAKNLASTFNAGEANKLAMFAVSEANKAAEFLAAAENAARSQNAAAYNKAMQAYTDAQNAALAAQFDAENLARRDTAMFEQQTREGDANRRTAVETASIGAGATVTAASIRAQSDAAALAANAADRAADRDARRREFDTNTQMSIDRMGQDSLNNYRNGVNYINSLELDPESRANMMDNFNAISRGDPYLPITIGEPEPDNPPPPEGEP